MSTLVKPSFKLLFQMALPCLFLAGLFNMDVTYDSLQSTVSSWPELCFFHRWTGWLCPGCGMTRAMICFFSYNLSLSYFYHPMGPVLGFTLLALWGVSFSPRSWRRVTERGAEFFKRHAFSTLVVALAWGVYRNWI